MKDKSNQVLPATHKRRIFFFLGISLLALESPLLHAMSLDSGGENEGVSLGRKRNSPGNTVGPSRKQTKCVPLGSPDYLLEKIHQELEKKRLTDRAALEKLVDKNTTTSKQNSVRACEMIEQHMHTLKPYFTHSPSSPSLPSEINSRSDITMPLPQLSKVNKNPRESRHKSAFLKETRGQSAEKHAHRFGNNTKEPLQILHLQAYRNHGPSADTLGSNLVVGSRGTNHAMRARDEQMPSGVYDAPFASVIPGSRVAQHIWQVSLNPLTRNILTLSSPLPAFMTMEEGKVSYKQNKNESNPALILPVFLAQNMSKLNGNEDTWRSLEDLPLDPAENREDNQEN